MGQLCPTEAPDGLDVDRACRLAAALEALVVEPLARPVVAELRRVLEDARGAVAEVKDLSAERARRARGVKQ